MVENPKYMDALEALVDDCLGKGMDVIEMPDGEIVTTGTRIITSRYRWNTEKESIELVAHEERHDDSNGAILDELKKIA